MNSPKRTLPKRCTGFKDTSFIFTKFYADREDSFRVPEKRSETRFGTTKDVSHHFWNLGLNFTFPFGVNGSWNVLMTSVFHVSTYCTIFLLSSLYIYIFSDCKLYKTHLVFNYLSYFFHECFIFLSIHAIDIV